MNEDDPFDNCGLDFGFVRDYFATPQTHISKNEYEYCVGATTNSGCYPPFGVENVQIFTSASSKDNRLLFVAGYPTPEQVNRLTKKYNINPEVWRRHLATPNIAIEDTRLPSASCNIIQLRFWTIASWVNTFDRHQIPVQTLRKDAKLGLKRYLETLLTLNSWRSGDSVVRNYEIHDRTYFSLEQVVTMYTYVNQDRDSDGSGNNWLGPSATRLL